jgi:hypothetical protein
MESLARGEDDASGHYARAPLAITPAVRRARRTLFITKPGGLLGLRWSDLPDDVTLLSRFGLPQVLFPARSSGGGHDR